MAEYTIDELLKKAEENKLPNTNITYILSDRINHKPIQACVIGAIAIELGKDWIEVVNSLQDIGGVPRYYSLTGMINDLNDERTPSGHFRTRKAVIRKIRKLLGDRVNEVVKIY